MRNAIWKGKQQKVYVRQLPMDCPTEEPRHDECRETHILSGLSTGGKIAAHLEMTQAKNPSQKSHPWSSRSVLGLSGCWLERLCFLPIFWHTGFCLPAKPATVTETQWWDKFQQRNRDFSCFQLKEVPCKSSSICVAVLNAVDPTDTHASHWWQLYRGTMEMKTKSAVYVMQWEKLPKLHRICWFASLLKACVSLGLLQFRCYWG